jgi:aryl-alcohol dehydrogenase-like predicted oxidoreductase
MLVEPLIDTVDGYTGNAAEKIIGGWLAARPNEVTDRVVLATKGRMGDPSDENGVGLSRRHLQRALDASLRRLGVERVDLYQLHAADMHTPMVETLSFLDSAIRAGKMRLYGLSNFTGWQIQLMVSTAKAMGIPAPVTHQPQYSLLSRWVEWEVIPAARHNGLGLLPWAPLAGGLLSGKYNRAPRPEEGTRAGSEKGLYQWSSEDYSKSDQNWETIDAVVSIARESGVTPSQVALSWLAKRPGVTASIFGTRTREHLADNLGAADLVLDEKATAALDAASAPVAPGFPYDALGEGQRGRWLKDDSPAPVQPYEHGSEHPLGRADI